MRDTGNEARIHFPIEGHTKWPFVMQVMVFGSIATAMVLLIVYFLLLAPKSLSLGELTVILWFFLLLLGEVAVVRMLVIPMRGDYGRFRVTKDRVDLFPLSRYGFSVLPDPVGIPITAFTSISVKVADGREKGIYYDVFLNHPQRSRTIRIRGFETKAQAESFGRALAEELVLSFLNV